MTTYYEVVVQLFRKTCEETVQLLSCCLWRKKKRFGLTFSLLPRQKKPNKSLDYNCICLPVYSLLYFLNYLFFYLFVFIIYLLINLSVYLCIYLFHCLCICVILVQGGGVSEQKGTKRLVERLFQQSTALRELLVRLCFVPIYQNDNIKKSKSQEN